MKRFVCILLCLLTLGSAAAGEGTHFALKARDCGPCKKLLGDVMILVVFVNTPKHPWTEKKRNEVYDISWSSINHMNKNARKYKANLNLSLGFLEYTVKYEADEALIWYWDIIHNIYHEQSIEQVNARYRHDLKVDDAPMIFMFNSWDVSHTYACSVDSTWKEEFCVIFCDTKMHDNYLTHELYHQYGAIDLYDYRNEGIARITSRYFPRNVMQCTGNDIDDLTAYLIGWTNRLSPTAKEFLRKIDGRR